MKMRIQRDPDGLTKAEYIVAGVIGAILALLFWAVMLTFSPPELSLSSPSKDQLRIMAYHGVTYAEEEKDGSLYGYRDGKRFRLWDPASKQKGKTTL
jgi:hypothetical protein